MQDIALDIFSICVRNGISLDVQWIPRDLNSIADDMRRVIDFDDYTIHDDVFDTLDRLWGPHSCDDLLPITTQSLLFLTHVIFSQGLVVSMPFHKIGGTKTTGCVVQCI